MVCRNFPYEVQGGPQADRSRVRLAALMPPARAAADPGGSGQRHDQQEHDDQHQIVDLDGARPAMAPVIHRQHDDRQRRAAAATAR